MIIVQATRIFAVALILVLTATGLWAAAAEEASAAAVEKEMVLDPSTGEMVTTPEYGGTITGVLKLDWTWQFDTKPPFDDIRVCRAMQMAVDLETINDSYFQGYGSTTPMGMTSVPGFFIPFEEWPQEVRNAYTYDPEGAEALLDDAGYPRGADGVRFEFSLLRRSAQSDLSYDQLVAAYWREIGVEMEIEIVDRPVVQAAIGARDFDMTGTRVSGMQLRATTRFTTACTRQPWPLAPMRNRNRSS